MKKSSELSGYESFRYKNGKMQLPLKKSTNKNWFNEEELKVIGILIKRRNE